MTTDMFNLQALIRDLCNTSSIADPRELAKEVNQRIPAVDRDTALEQALPVVVQTVLGQMRMTTATHSTSLDTVPTPVSSPGSWKVRGIRETWQRMLQDRIYVGPDKGGWKLLRECTAVDLAFAAAVREEQARRNTASAARYRALSELLTAHGVSMVGELPETVLAESLSGAA